MWFCLIPAMCLRPPYLVDSLTLAMLAFVGTNHVALDGTITAGIGNFTVTRQGSIGDTTTGFGDLYPAGTLRWNSGVNNFMIYGTGDIPVGRL